MFSFDYSDIPQQQTLLPNFHSPPPYSTGFTHDERSPFQFHHQTLSLPHQMGLFLPQTLHQDPHHLSNKDGDASLMMPNSASVYDFNCNQGSLGLLSPAKKDRHSKISTAQGVRDRRVRLSMAIAREFFDLQDLLGFDKASKTIGWLLAKSKGAIQELAGGSGPGLSLSRSNSSASSDHHEDAFANSSTTDMTVMRMETTRKRSVSSTQVRQRSRKSAPKDENQANLITARENRAKARARARARTMEKLSTVAKSFEFDDLGLNTSGRTSCSSQFLTDSKDQNISRSLHDPNVMIRSCYSPPLISCPGYLQRLLSAPTGGQDGSVRANHLPNLITASNNSESSMCSSFSGWNILSFPSEMHMTSKPYWETLDNQVEQQYNQHQGELR